MTEPVPVSHPVDETDADTARFYRGVLETLNASSLPYLIGGAYAFNRHTDVNRPTRDLDIFIRRADFDRIGEALRAAGYQCELTYPHWLGKVHHQEVYIDLIFSSGNAIAEVDDAWFEHASPGEVLGVPVKICPAEEMIWSKAFIMEKERFDGADIAHLIRARGHLLDWPRMFRRFEPHWRVLLSHLVLFGFVYPAHRDIVPAAIMDELIERLHKETHSEPPDSSLCLGTLLSREQYLNDIRREGLQDGRIAPVGKMTPEDTEQWTRAISDDHDPD
ncbi:nucleotidyltransferase family protein [Noviherbaspirillum aridicola]|uniref:Nucleotidyltransferase-like protein n=1 Tax=Noviherbaspirillum aridicola TaxID=2849687 RepID=A0ABQ4Q3K7_9BURK|nr:nucleotidyltransferase [Noviherbaspirillum aridicola]GIZ51768.1 hypothetical protein NCCP691_17820 [Noviherbaspirillum aridicola]